MPITTRFQPFERKLNLFSQFSRQKKVFFLSASPLKSAKKKVVLTFPSVDVFQTGRKIFHNANRAERLKTNRGMFSGKSLVNRIIFGGYSDVLFAKVVWRVIRLFEFNLTRNWKIKYSAYREKWSTNHFLSIKVINPTSIVSQKQLWLCLMFQFPPNTNSR